MKHIDIIVNEWDEKRNRSLTALKEMFESEFPKHFNEERVNELLADQIRRDLKFQDIEIAPMYPGGIYGPNQFPFDQILYDYGFKKRFGLYNKQIKLREMNLEVLIDDLFLGRLPKYEDVVKDVIQDSNALSRFRKILQEKGVKTTLVPDSISKSIMILKLHWD